MVAIAAILRVLFFVAASPQRGMGFVFAPHELCRLPHRVHGRARSDTTKRTYQYDATKDEILLPQSAVQSAIPSITNDISTQSYNQKTYRKIVQFLKAGTSDTPRILHSIIGLCSIALGLHHMIEVLISSSFTDAECRVSTIVGSGCIHTFAGLLGLRRLNFNNDKEAARNAMFWPAPIQSFWLASVSLTEWGYVARNLLSAN